jgi:hypothetical protein
MRFFTYPGSSTNSRINIKIPTNKANHSKNTKSQGQGEKLEGGCRYMYVFITQSYFGC